MQETLTVPQGEFRLFRYPQRTNEQLRAWDAADAYLLDELHDSGLQITASPLVLNDSFGALSVPLSAHRPQVISDSFLSHTGIRNNLLQNDLRSDSVKLLTSLQQPQGLFDLALIKVPKNLALLEDQLHRVRPRLKPETVIIGAGMVKGIHNSTLQMFERIVGPTRTSLARQKARLIHCTFDPQLSPGASPYPTTYQLEGSYHQLTNHANVFSRERLDIGTRQLLEHIPMDSQAKNIVDLGCGNGVVGLVASEKNPRAEIIFTDESYMAVKSAEENFRTAFGHTRQATFMATNALDGITDKSVDLILNNPPFHQQNAVGDQVAWEMFRESRRVLKPEGKLLIVGNRHLGYHTKLKRLFGNCRVIASNRKFVIFETCKQKPHRGK